MNAYFFLRIAKRQLAPPLAHSWRLVVVLGLFLAFNERGQPSTNARPDFWIPDGFISVMLETNGTLYLGGQFENFVPDVGRGGDFNIFSAESNPLWPKADGTVAAIVPDGLGGFFVKGSPISLSGQREKNDSVKQLFY